MINKKFNKWTVLSDAGRDKFGSILFNCKCNCGNESTILKSTLISNKSSQCRECGYKYRKTVDIIKNTHDLGNNYRHGYYGSLTYKTWAKMKARCNSNTKAYYNKKTYNYYGAKNIVVCERWMQFKNFLEDMGEQPIGKQIDRIDSNGNYEFSNCRWVTPLENNHNRDYVKNKIKDMK